jgi:hypothetical protein
VPNRFQGVPNWEKVADPNVLQQLGGQAAPANDAKPNFGAVQDPNLLNQLNGKSNITPIEQVAKKNEKGMNNPVIKHMLGFGSTPAGNVRDFAYGMGNDAAHIAKLANSNAPEMPDIRQQNNNPMAEGLGSYAPFAMAGGPSLLGSTAAAGTFGATQYDKGQPELLDTVLGLKPGGRMRSTAEDMLINALTHGLTKVASGKMPPVPDARFKQNANFGSPTGSQFMNQPVQTPNFLQEKTPEALSPKIAEQLHQDITGNRNFEASGKDLAQKVHGAYQKIHGEHSNLYNDIWDSNTKNVSVHDDEPIKVKDTLIQNGDYTKNFHAADLPDSNIKLLHDRFIASKSIQNAHRLQSELGSEIGYLRRQKENLNLDASGKNKLANYVSARKTLQEDMRAQLEDLDPKFKEQYDHATEQWEKNVIPYHTDKDLRGIAEGKIKNPTTGQITSIFQNPEDNINKVVGDLPQEAKDRIVHIGMGKTRAENTPADMIKGQRALEAKGMTSYVNPHFEQAFDNIKSNLQMEKERGAHATNQQAMVKALQDAHKQGAKVREAAEKARIARQKAASEEAGTLMEDKRKELQKQIEASAKAAHEDKLRRNNMIRSLVGGGIGFGAVHGLGINLEDLLGAELGRFLTHKINKK